jgi:hypothetical protein
MQAFGAVTWICDHCMEMFHAQNRATAASNNHKVISIFWKVVIDCFWHPEFILRDFVSSDLSVFLAVTESHLGSP